VSKRNWIRDAGALLLLTAAAILVHGYHYGVQDGACYMPAIEKRIDPQLFPLDASFFLTPARYSLLVPALASTVRYTGISLEAASLAWQVLGLFLLLAAARKLARLCYADPHAQWGALITVWGTLLLPVAGTGIAITERYLHPRNLALGAVVFAIAAAFEHQPRALAWLAGAVAIHPTIGICGVFHCAVQWWGAPRRTVRLRSGPGPAAKTQSDPGKRSVAGGAMLGAPLLLLFFGLGTAQPTSLAPHRLSRLASLLPTPDPLWRAILQTRPYLFVTRWHWYEWLGVAAPMVLLLVLASVAQAEDALAAHLARRAALAAVLGTAGSLVIATVPALIVLVPTEPMRVLQFVYFAFVFIAGGLLGKYVLVAHGARWTLFVLALSAIFYAADKVEYPASAHIEWPGAHASNAWLASFAWARANTPQGALFALDPLYTLRSGEDAHGFRAYAERSMLADWVKDRSIVEVNPDVAFAWWQQTQATRDWGQFRKRDFARLAKFYGVDWAVLERSHPAARQLDCPYDNGKVMVCKLQ
jgi:hypothetical protein